MWNMTKEVKDTFEKRNLLPIHETDDEWEIVLREAQEEGEDILSRLDEELNEVREELYQILPERFHPYVDDGTLNKPSLPTLVRKDYLSWMREGQETFEKFLTLASEQTDKAVKYLSEEVRLVFADSLHDSFINRIERPNENQLTLFLETGGFSKMDVVVFEFGGVTFETNHYPLTVGETIVYYEMHYKNNRFHFRILTDNLEWTITFKDLVSEYFYRPALYTILNDEEKLLDITLEEYLLQLDDDKEYWLITPDGLKFRIESLHELKLDRGRVKLHTSDLQINVDEEIYTHRFDEGHPTKLIYTNEFEDPYGYLDEMLPAEEIIPSIFGENIHLQAQAWNTLYNDPLHHKVIIHQVLSKIQVTEENEMTLSIFINHFNELNILEPAMLDKFKLVIYE